MGHEPYSVRAAARRSDLSVFPRGAARSARRLDVAATDLPATLTDPEISSYRVVVHPEKIVVREAERAISHPAPSSYGFPPPFAMGDDLANRPI